MCSVLSYVQPLLHSLLSLGDLIRGARNIPKHPQSHQPSFLGNAQSLTFLDPALCNYARQDTFHRYSLDTST